MNVSNNESDKRIIQVKILTLGDSSVGKSSIILRYVNKKFIEIFQTTIGLDFKSKMVEYKGKSFELRIYDTAGQERFKAVSRQYYKNAEGIILVFDVSNRSSFLQIETWLADLEQNKKKKAQILLVGNKIDLPNREVDTAEAEEIAEKYGVRYLEVSAKSGEKIDEIFINILDLLIDNYDFNEERSIRLKDKSDEDDEEEKKEEEKQGCCSKQTN